MFTASLRKVGGSVMLAVPPAIMDMLGMECGMSVNMEVEAGSLVIKPESRREYALERLLEECDPDMYADCGDREWLSDKAYGRELI